MAEKTHQNIPLIRSIIVDQFASFPIMHDERQKPSCKYEYEMYCAKKVKTSDMSYTKLNQHLLLRRKPQS